MGSLFRVRRYAPDGTLIEEISQDEVISRWQEGYGKILWGKLEAVDLNSIPKGTYPELIKARRIWKALDSLEGGDRGEE